MELRTSEERLRTLAESLPNLVWTCRPDGGCDYLSRQWVEYTGRPIAEQLGSGWADHVHPEDRAVVEREWAHAVLSQSAYDVEFRLRRHDGVYRWFKARAIPLLDGRGEVVKWFGSNTDIEDYKSAETKMRTQLERLDLLDRTTRAIGNRLDAHSILQIVVRNVEDHLGVDLACVCLANADKSALTVTCVGARSLKTAKRLEFAQRVAGGGLSSAVVTASFCVSSASTSRSQPSKQSCTRRWSVRTRTFGARKRACCSMSACAPSASWRAESPTTSTTRCPPAALYVSHTVARMREFYRPQESTSAEAPVSINRLLEQVIQLTRARWLDIPQERGIVIHVRREFSTVASDIIGVESEIRDAVTNLILNGFSASRRSCRS